MSVRGLRLVEEGDRVLFTPLEPEDSPSVGICTFVGYNHVDIDGHCMLFGKVEPKPYTLDETIAFLRGVVDRQGDDYVYGPGTCRYVGPSGEPSCIVGHVVHDAGFDIAKLKEVSVRGNAILARWFTPNALDLLRIAQTAQDLRTPWGKALELASRLVEWEE